MTQEDQILPSKEENLVSPDSDFFLMALVELNNLTSLEMSITLFVQGTIIIGKMIGEKTYFEGVSNQLKGAGFPDEGINTFIASCQVSEKQPDNSTEKPEISAEKNEPTNRKFIHLKDARVYPSNSPISTDKGVFWRGRLSQIDGFVLAG